MMSKKRDGKLLYFALSIGISLGGIKTKRTQACWIRFERGEDSVDDHVLYHVFEAAQKLSDFHDNQDYMKLMQINRAFAKAGEDYFFKNTHSITLDESDGYFVVSGYKRNGTKSFTLFNTEPDFFINILELLRDFDVPVRDIDISNFPPFCMEPRILEILASFSYVQNLTMFPSCLCEGPCPLMKPNLNCVTYMTTSAFLSFKNLHITNVSMYIRCIKQAMRVALRRMEEDGNSRTVSENDAYMDLLQNIGHVDNLTFLDANVYYLPFIFVRELILRMQVKCLKLTPCESPFGWDFGFATEIGCIDRGPLSMWPDSEEKIPIENLFFMSVNKVITEDNFVYCSSNLIKWFECTKCLTIEYSGIEDMEAFQEKLLRFRTVFKGPYPIQKVTLRLFVQRPPDVPTEPPLQQKSYIEEFSMDLRRKYILFGYENVIIKTPINPRTIEAVVYGYDKEITLNITIMGTFVNI
ncbi:unnamed protein product [Auanema sp. JU1783]|nr:unnamed protein product [Auanema sp. JU1783]